MASLLDSLREAGAQEQATALAERAAAHVSLDNPGAVAGLLDACGRRARRTRPPRWPHRAAAHVSLNDPDAVASLLGNLREMGAQDQATALADRLPGAGLFELFLGEQGGGRQDRFRFGRDADGSPDKPWGWEDLD